MKIYPLLLYYCKLWALGNCVNFIWWPHVFDCHWSAAVFPCVMCGTAVILLCSNIYKASPISLWYIMIFSWQKFVKYVFVCWPPTYPFIYCHFALFLWGDLFLYCLAIVMFLPQFPKYSNYHVNFAMQSNYEFNELIICLRSVDFQHLPPVVVLHWYWGGLYMSPYSGYYVSSFITLILELQSL